METTEVRRETGRLVESTQAEDRRMIALVAARPLLYARSTLPVASYYSQVKQLWQEVADLMGWTVAEVRRKWSHIRNSYSRHLRNEIYGLRTGRGRMVSRWYLADDLEFLRQHMATDTRPSSQYSVMSPFAPSLLEMEVSVGGAEEAGDVKSRAWFAEGTGTEAGDVKPRAWFGEGTGAEAGDVKPRAWFGKGTGAEAGDVKPRAWYPAGTEAGDVKPRAWYAAPEPAPDDSCGSHSLEPDESVAYFDFFRGIYKDYRELTPQKQRLFRRQCLILLHGLVDGEQGGGAGGVGRADVVGAAGGEGGEGGEEGGAVNLSGYGSDSERDQKCFVQDLQVVNCDAETAPDDNNDDNNDDDDDDNR